eukprot:GEMP01046531.1.p1 GENE.GEMP01046531.1~~GEMP01046531.1.p1  ORF type:complete len:363 (+),score=48.58 GEMP01046531.1:72-1091(+)
MAELPRELRVVGDDRDEASFTVRRRPLIPNPWCIASFFLILCIYLIRRTWLSSIDISPARSAVHYIGSPAPPSNPKRFAYVWYLSDLTYQCGILVAADTVQKSNPQTNVDFVVLHNIRITDTTRFAALNIRTKQMDTPFLRGADQYGSSFTKLWASHLFEYDRVIYFDVDTFVLNSLDHLFYIAPFPVEIAAPRAYWLPQPFAGSGGPLVMSPQRLFYSRDFQQALETSSAASEQKYAGEMDWVNKHFRDRINLLDGFYALLVGEWCDDDRISKYWQNHFGVNASTLVEMAPLVHFVASWKPWHITNRARLQQMCKNPQPELAQVYQKWWDASARLCSA